MTDAPHPSLSAEAKAAADTLDLTQREVAARIGLGQSSWSQAASGAKGGGTRAAVALVIAMARRIPAGEARAILDDAGRLLRGGPPTDAT